MPCIRKTSSRLAVDKGFYNPKSGPFNFSLAYNPPTEDQVRYSARRVWSIFRRAALSSNLSPDFSSSVKNAKPYPLWIKPDSKLSVRDVMALHRDHYEGTVFDMTKDLSAGPFGAPDRWRPINWEIEGKILCLGAPDFHPAGRVHFRLPVKVRRPGLRGRGLLVWNGQPLYQFLYSALHDHHRVARGLHQGFHPILQPGFRLVDV